MKKYKPYKVAGIVTAAIAVPGVLTGMAIYYNARIFVKVRKNLRNPKRKTLEQETDE